MKNLPGGWGDPRRWVEAVDLGDEARNQMAANLQWVTLISITASLLTSVVYMFLIPRPHTVFLLWSLSLFLSGVVWLVRLNRRGVAVVVAPNLPVVDGDRVRLVEALQNLLDNGVKFMGGQSQPRSEIGARPDGAGTIFFVRDNGQGAAFCFTLPPPSGPHSEGAWPEWP